MEVSPPSLGIDLGTTFTVGCICDPPNNSGAQPLTIINFRNDVDQIRPQFLPSKVYFTAEKNYFGSSAEQEWKNSKNNKNYIYNAKRIIGQRMGEQRLENDRKCWPFQLREDPNAKAHRRSPYIYMENLPHDKYVSPEVVSTELIKEVVRRANESLNLKHSLINSAVITCPAYFSGAQRRATMRAAEAAKINVLAIIDEPTAAAIAYAESECHAQDQCILVYDIGGGTFDVSIMEMKDKEISVLAISGDNHLGGEDVVQEMMDYCLDQWRGGWQPFIDKFEALRADDETRKEIEEELVNECRRVIAMLRGWNCYSARVHLKKRKGWPTAPWINVKYNDVDLNSQNNVQEMKKHCLKEWKTQKNYGIVAYMTKYEAAASDVRDQIDQEFLQTCLHALEKLKNKSSQSATLQLKTVGGWPNPPTYKLFSSLLRGLSKHGNVLLEDHDVAENLKTHCFKAWNKLSQEGRYINCFDELDSEDLNADEHPMRCEIKRELRDQCEEAKKMLKDAGSVTIRLLQRFGLPALEFAMTRSKLEEICLTNSADLRKTMGCLQSALSKANKQASDIDKVLLIGGSAELPHISSFLRGKCDGYFPDTGENSASEMMKIVFPEKAFVDISCDKKQYVATGAAIHARRVQEHKTKDESTWTLPRSIGIGYEGGLVEKVLMRGTLLPCVNTTIVFNSSPQQKELVIEIFEGEDVNGNAEANRLITGSSYKTVNKLKTSVVYDIPTRAEGRGDQAFDVKLEVSIDFDLKVSIRPIDHIDTWAPIKLLSDEKNTENTDGLTVKWIDYDYESIHIDRTINEEKGEIDIGFLLFWRDLRQAEILLRRWRQAAEKLGDQRILAEIRQVQEFIDDNELLSREEINEQVDRLFVKVKSSDLPI